MNRKSSYFLSLSLVIVLFLSFVLTPQVYAERGISVTSLNTERRIALVIGNSSYESSPLKNPVNDATDIAATLTKLGFQVLGKDMSKKAMRRAARAFGKELKQGGVGLFYFAGHGMQVDGKNFLIPVGTDIETEDKGRIVEEERRRQEEEKSAQIKLEKAEKRRIREANLSTGRSSSDGRYVNNGDGTISDSDTGLMWAKEDSYADLGECLDWNKSRSYVSTLTTGGYNDWRMPTVEELKSIYEKSKNNKTYSGDTIHSDPIFASGGGHYYWSSETKGTSYAREVFFHYGGAGDSKRDDCSNGGVRAVRR